MRHTKFALLLLVVGGLFALNRQEHQRTRAKLDELAAAIVTKPDLTTPPASPEIVVQPAGQMPVELSHVTLPPYVIEAPDQLMIEAVIRDSKTNTMDRLPVQPISGPFQVRCDGTVGLGYWGSVTVTGLTLEQAASAVQKHLVGTAVWKAEASRFAPPVVVIDVLAYNSKRYYVVTVGEQGEQVLPFPQTGTESVLDALTGVDGLLPAAAKGAICVKRKTASGVQTLPVDLAAITQRGVTTTNYQILSGDRIYVTLAK